MKKVFGLAFMMLLLTGCFGGEKTTTVCKSSLDNNTTTIDAEGDEVTKMKAVIKTDIPSYYDDAEAKELIEEEASKLYPDDVKGLDYKVVVKDGVATETITIDYAKADLDELEKAGLVEAAAGEDDVDYISLEKTTDGLGSGFSCKEE